MAHPRGRPPRPAAGRPGGDRGGAGPGPDRVARAVPRVARTGRGPVVVVDDGSEDPDAVAEVCRRHGATLIRRAVNGGPGAARNQALAVVATELVAFVDSDCEVDRGGWTR